MRAIREKVDSISRMPFSAVAYTSEEHFTGLAALLRERFEDREIKPYTLSFAQRQAAGSVRFRATEFAPGVLMPLLADMAEKRPWSWRLVPTGNKAGFL